jgi:hypothetical protein
MKDILGTKNPIVVEFTYDDWKRLDRLSNRCRDWINKFYDAVLAKARIISLAMLHEDELTLDITKVVLGHQAYRKFAKILKHKYPDREARAWLNFDVGPVE